MPTARVLPIVRVGGGFWLLVVSWLTGFGLVGMVGGVGVLDVGCRICVIGIVGCWRGWWR